MPLLCLVFSINLVNKNKRPTGKLGALEKEVGRKLKKREHMLIGKGGGGTEKKVSACWKAKKRQETLKRRGEEWGVERGSEGGLLQRQSMNSSHAEEEEEGGGVCEDMDYELGGKGGQRRVRGEGELAKEERKRGLKGCRARCEGIWGWQQRDGCFGGAQFVLAHVRGKEKRPSDPPVFSRSLQGRLRICQRALINVTEGSNLTTCSACAGMLHRVGAAV